jgi:hypothetical protein
MGRLAFMLIVWACSATAMSWLVQAYAPPQDDAILLTRTAPAPATVAILASKHNGDHVPLTPRTASLPLLSLGTFVSQPHLSETARIVSTRNLPSLSLHAQCVRWQI